MGRKSGFAGPGSALIVGLLALAAGCGPGVEVSGSSGSGGSGATTASGGGGSGGTGASTAGGTGGATGGGGSGGATGGGGSGGATGGGGAVGTCDNPAPAVGDHLASLGFGDAQKQAGTSLAPDGQGRLFAAVAFKGEVDFGTGPLVSGGDYDVAIAKLEPEGQAVWARSFGDAALQLVSGVAADGAGNAIAAGYFGGTLDFGGGGALLTSTSIQNGFVVKLDPDGNVVWAHAVPSDDAAFITGVAADGGGDVFVVGGFKGSLNFGLVSPQNNGGQDCLVAKLDPQGNVLWVRGFGGSQDEFFTSATAVQGGLVVTGVFYGTVDFGNGPVIAPAQEGQNGIVVKLDDNGNTVFAKQIGGPESQAATSVAEGPGGEIYVAGARGGVMSSAIDFGEGPIPGIGFLDTFVTRYAPNGDLVWGKLFGGPAQSGLAAPISLRASCAGEIVLAGYGDAGADFGGGPLDGPGMTDALVVKLDANGDHLWSKLLGGPGLDQAIGIAPLSAESIAVTGLFNGTASFGGGDLVSAGDNDMFWLLLSP